MRKTIKKYQPGGRIPGKVPKGVKVDTAGTIKQYRDMMGLPTKKTAPKKAAPKRAVDLSAPGKGMIKELEKKGSMPPSQKNVGRRGIKVGKAKGGKEMIKRADGSYSQRGLWDNIRANRGSGKKPTAAMLKQEKKIKAKSKK
jgi:hypothetical protein